MAGSGYIGGAGTSSAQNTLHVQGTGITLSEGDKDRVSIHPATSGTDEGSFIIKCRSGGSPVERFRVAHDGTFTGSSTANISDERLKENIATIPNALESVSKLKGRTFTWKEEAKMTEGTKYGLIAQELEEVFPELIYDKSGIVQKEDGSFYKSVRMDGIIPVLIEAVKELSAKVEALENA